jgi:exodeoxyribonuclease VII small subunit
MGLRPSTMPRAATTPTPQDAAPASYEDAVQELEQIVASMEGSALPLDRLLDSYTRAATLLEYCRGRLEAVETQVKVLEKGQLAPWIGAGES